MINHKHKCIFIHIPKCGGSSVELALDGRDWWNVKPRKLKHMSATDSRLYYREYWDNYTKFSFVRNPYSLQVSWYFFKKLQNVITFKDYVINESLNRVSRYSRKLDDMSWKGIIPDILTCHQYITTDGRVELDFVGKQENMQQDFNDFCHRYDIPLINLPLENQSKHKHYTEYYDNETRDIVATRYAKDIEYFGYKFGE